jgi:diguanylate cyclase (GGDEF)-like protein/PAS domain S-box-containing protein
MGSEKHLLYFIALVIAVVFIIIGVYTYRNRNVPGAPALIVLLLAAMGYAVPYTLLMTSHSLAAARLWYNVSIPGANLLAPAWLIFSLTWSGGEKNYSRHQVTTFLIEIFSIPLLVCLAAWTNASHSLYGNNFHFDPQKSLPVLVWDFGIFYWVGFLYAYGVLSVGLIILLNKVFKRLRLFFQQSMLLLIGALIPVFVNIAFAAGFSFIPGFDLTPYTFLVTGIIWSIAVFKFHFLEIVPVAHQRVFKQIPAGILVLDNQLRVLEINPAACEIMNLSALQVIGQRLPAKFAACLGDLIGDNENIPRNKQITHLCQQGKPSYLDIQKTALFDRKKNHIGSLILFSDVTEKKQSQEALQESETKFRNLFEASPIGIELFDADGILRDANATCLQIFGLTNIAVARGFNLFDDPNVSQSIKRDLTLGKSVRYESEFDFDLVRKNNLYSTSKQGKIYLDTQITPLVSSQGAISGYMVQLQDVSERKKLEEELKYRSTHDALTGLFNWHFFETEIERLQNSRKYPIGILVIDMNGLKKINDTHGHSAGDTLLRQAADVIKKSFRPDEMIARIGGDEFAVVLPQTNSAAVGRAVQRLKENIRENNLNGLLDQEISLSVGTAICENNQTSLKKTFKLADRAMYIEKAESKMQLKKEDLRSGSFYEEKK